MKIKKTWWSSSSGLFELKIPVDAIGACKDLIYELKEYGAWDDLHTVSLDTLKQRMFWLACGDLADQQKEVKK